MKPIQLSADLTLIRYACPDDINLIRNAWYRGVRETKPNILIPSNLFHQHQSILMTRRLADSAVLVLSHPDDPSQIYGFIIYQVERGILIVHWAWTRHIWRRSGVMTRLLCCASSSWRSNPIILTSPAKQLDRLLGRFKNLTFDPNLGIHD